MVNADISIYFESSRVSKESIKEAVDLWSTEIGENSHSELLWRELGNVDSFEFREDDGFHIDVGMSDGSSVSVNVPMSDQVLLDVMQYAVKRLNKLKTVLEGLK